ncbi:GNAT family N-acetyltransferase [Reichenbachiella versicolor]|uniref:GNAT family N-acetyltransferase n=1 Tax=Reichenbachiella versicolor TaxID=1821036 RepID=UPI0016256BF3|nr:GNAT family N-acetyltransferase [Reichenbachiella versicolor]
MIKYRAASLSDVSNLLVLEQEIIEAERPFNPTIKNEKTHYYDLEQLISDKNTYLIVAEESNRLVGTGYAQIRKSVEAFKHSYHSYLGFMYVIPEYRGQGINKNIINELLNWSKDRDVFDFYLEVYSENEAAIKAYQKAGFNTSFISMKLNLNQ